MQKLTLIENELVPVYKTSTGEKVVYMLYTKQNNIVKRLKEVLINMK